MTIAFMEDLGKLTFQTNNIIIYIKMDFCLYVSLSKLQNILRGNTFIIGIY